jgi:hypothetical protein
MLSELMDMQLQRTSFDTTDSINTGIVISALLEGED